MSAACRFCKRTFANEQAVRAHLKSCAPYQARDRHAVPEDESLGDRASGSGSLGEGASEAAATLEDVSEPVRQLRQRLATERLRLELRSVEEAHAELDRRENAAARQREREADDAQAQTRAREQRADEERRRVADTAAEEARRVARREQRRARRRQKVQLVIDKVVTGWFSGVVRDPEIKSKVVAAIERELADLPVEDMTEGELVAIATGIRDSKHRAAKQEQERREQLVTQRTRLIQYGREYAESELRSVDGLQLVERWRIERRVADDLEAVNAHDSLDDMKDRVDAILEDEGLIEEADDE